MTTDVLFGDVEQSVITWMQDQLTERVSDRPASVTPAMRDAGFVVVERLGGPRTSLVAEDATLTIEAWAADWVAANDLALRARQAIHSIKGENIEGLTFYLVNEFSGPARLPGPDSKTPRVVFTVSTRVRCTTP